MNTVKRLRIFAGPNGSGKSSVFERIAKDHDMGVWVNADQLKKDLEPGGKGVALSDLHPALNFEAFQCFYHTHWILLKYGISFPFKLSEHARLILAAPKENPQLLSYVVLCLADYLRNALIKSGADTISTETVFSHESKLAFIRDAKQAGYRVYLYYVCVEDAEICKDRVAERTQKGGHNVPADKIQKRYKRSLALLREAIVLADRTYLLDNTYSKALLKLEITPDRQIITHEPQLPAWIVNHLPAFVPAATHDSNGNVQGT